jgi:hypothetical protein
MCGRAVVQTCLVLVVVFAGATATWAQPEFQNPNTLDGPRPEGSLMALAVAELNVGCNASTLILVNCQDRGTQLGRLLAIQLASYPVSAPTGGFSFTFDAKARAFLKAASSFGPSFA